MKDAFVTALPGLSAFLLCRAGTGAGERRGKWERGEKKKKKERKNEKRKEDEERDWKGGK